MLYIVAVGVTAGWYLARAMEHRGVRFVVALSYIGTAALCSYPCFFELQRCNAEIFLWTATVVAVWLLMTGRDSWATTCIGFAAAMKIFPILLLVIFLLENKFSKVFLGLGCFVASDVIALAILGPDIVTAYRGTSLGVKKFTEFYDAAIRPQELPFNRSLCSIFKVLYQSCPTLHIWNLYRWMQLYTAVAAAIGLRVHLPVFTETAATEPDSCVTDDLYTLSDGGLSLQPSYRPYLMGLRHPIHLGSDETEKRIARSHLIYVSLCLSDSAGDF